MLETFGDCIPSEINLRGFPSLMFFDAPGRESFQGLDSDQTSLAVDAYIGTSPLNSIRGYKFEEYMGKRDIFSLIDFIQEKTGVRAEALSDLLRPAEWDPELEQQCDSPIYTIYYSGARYDFVEHDRCVQWDRNEIGEWCTEI